MITKVLCKLKRLFWLLPGFLLWASFPPMAERTDCLFALAPLLWLCRNADAKMSARRWFLNGFLFWFATLSWMPAIVKNGGPWPLVVLGWGALSAYCALYFGAFGWLSSKVWAWARDEGSPWRPAPRCPYARRLFALLVAEPVLWCGLEIVRSRFLGGFSRTQLGLPLVNAGFSLPASLGGTYLCSAVVVLVNGLAASVVERVWRPDPRYPRKWRWVESVLPLALVGALFAAGFVANLHLIKGHRPLRVTLVQRNFPCVFKPAEAEDPVSVYSNLLAGASFAQCELVVLPESALCEVGAVSSPNAMRFARRLLEQTGAAGVIAGGGRWAEGREYNSAALYGADGSYSVYDKVHLVPFGEFIPGDKLFPALQKLAPVGSCTPGKLKLLRLSTIPNPQSPLSLGVAICYEDTDSAQMRALARMGADVLVFVTNDSWFSRSIEAEQHSWQAVARAAETGLPVVRVGNSGVTGVVSAGGTVNWLEDDDGRVLVDRRGVMVETVRVPFDSGWVSVYVRLGDAPLLAAFALLLLGMILVKYKDNHEKRRYLSM